MEHVTQCYQSWQLCQEKTPYIAPVAPMQSFFFSGTIRVNWLRLYPSWHMQGWLPVFVSAREPILEVGLSISNNKYFSKNCSITATQWLNEVWSTRIGFHDKEREFENDLFSQLSKYCSVLQYQTTQNPPQTNGQTERINQTILTMLKTTRAPSDKVGWLNGSAN